VSERSEGSTGVWLDTHNHGKVRKICAIGVRASRYVTMHGFALNVGSDLNYFQKIIPCGIPDKKVTSMELELGEVAVQEVNIRILHYFKEVFGASFI
jgi:lipoyl(octanoyl) transferase